MPAKKKLAKKKAVKSKKRTQQPEKVYNVGHDTHCLRVAFSNRDAAQRCADENNAELGESRLYKYRVIAAPNPALYGKDGLAESW